MKNEKKFIETDVWALVLKFLSQNFEILKKLLSEEEENAVLERCCTDSQYPVVFETGRYISAK